MMSNSYDDEFQRSSAQVLSERLKEPRRFIQVLAGPRQVGKTTVVSQVLRALDRSSVYVSGDEPGLRDRLWLAAQWERARLLATSDPQGVNLAVDEVQKIPNWAETVKRLWDEDTLSRRPVQVVVLGSAPLLVQAGLTESLAGRFEIIPMSHWSFTEMQSAFEFSLDRFLYFGGYPGASALISDPARWRRYILDSLVEATLSRDVLLLTRVDRPALLRRLFDLGCRYSGQVLSFTKMLGQLADAGNTTTLAHYLDLLQSAGLLAGLQKYAGQAVRQRGSSPKLQVMNTALLTAIDGRTPEEVAADPQFMGRLVESAVGAHLVNAALRGECEVYYWRERNREVDFVVASGRKLVTIEVKSSRSPESLPGLAAFDAAFHPTRSLLVGGDGIPLTEFLSHPVEHWLQ